MKFKNIETKMKAISKRNTEEDAAKKYNLIASDKFGEFANLNVL